MTRENRPALYRSMKLIREFEERCLAMAIAGEIDGGIHPYIGQEAVAVGICANLTGRDGITSTHRGHGHVLAKGAEPRRLLAELLGTLEGFNKGRGGSMHAADMKLGILGANGIVGAGGAIASGAAWAAKARGDSDVVVSFFGDGAMSQGVLLEAFNLAAIWSLPVLFVCENNQYATSLKLEAGLAGGAVRRAEGFGLVSRSVDGMDVEAVESAAAELLEGVRAGRGPAFLECRTYRFFGHHSVLELLGVEFRDPDEVALWRTKDPIPLLGDQLGEDVVAGIDAAVKETIDEAVEFAKNAPSPDPKDALMYLYAGATAVRPGVSL
ncbi:thiamine pyrophosphate-dependent dehydrogenase E1 component subunit alpha [Amycolatopsis roodepoortensis]|uniref:thiamine pyrophosphate-dependent dehydrogenase E1 component subunit alpha n=1 Tax=Amycolatopsis roodepoortensis TaxID=700274 RepID=UPI00214C58DB|nr:thiamine pyrophosphate-dependent dehydrogenase E1 component subunit alpha [Amycolatopsis roodepoortensis]UUV29521.1 thiamine pyrophosphate-dependent dehydrogenase E1 component subunit alpha [Amycolatopsis roodepoortensis]